MSCFFAGVIFFRVAAFSELNFYWAATSWEKLVLYDSYFVGAATFLMKELVHNKDI